MNETVPNPSLPEGFTVALAPNVKRACGGRLLLGGAPFRVMSLSPEATRMIIDGQVVVKDRASHTLSRRLLHAGLAYPTFELGQHHEADLSDVTVVVPTHNRTSQLDDLLRLLRPTVDVVVVDDASTDPEGLADVVAGHGARLHRLETNQGPAAARNAGLAMVDTPVVAFIDSDVRVTPSDLRRLLWHLSDPNAVAVAPRVRSHPIHDPPRWYEKYDAECSSLDMGPVPAVVRPGSVVAYVPTACLIVRTHALPTGFDESMRAGEDVDLIWRLAGAGATIRYEPGVVVGHRVPETFRRWLSRKYLYGTSAAALASRHGDAVAPARLNPTQVAALASVVLLGRRRLPAVAATATWSTIIFSQRLRHVTNRGCPRVALAVDLSTRNLAWAGVQATHLLVRHWSPITLLAMAVSPRLRRMVLVATVVDTFITTAQRPRPRNLSDLLARRCEDLAYGFGVWAGAVRARSPRCLLPHVAMSPRERRKG